MVDDSAPLLAVAEKKELGIFLFIQVTHSVGLNSNFLHGAVVCLMNARYDSFQIDCALFDVSHVEILNSYPVVCLEFAVFVTLSPRNHQHILEANKGLFILLVSLKGVSQGQIRFDGGLMVIDLLRQTPQEFKYPDGPLRVVEHPEHLPKYIQTQNKKFVVVHELGYFSQIIRIAQDLLPIVVRNPPTRGPTGLGPADQEIYDLDPDLLQPENFS